LFLLVALHPTNVHAGATRATPQSIGIAEIERAERVLKGLGFLTGPVDGRLDPESRHALVAFRKVQGLKRTGSLTDADLAALASAAPLTPREAGYTHAEVDLARQVLYFVDEAGVVSTIVPISSGTGRPYFEKGRRGVAYTPRGRFTVTRKIAGWRRSPLGLLYFPSYIHDGTAIHGATSVPPYPASHGCIRIPVFAARLVSELLPVGAIVLVFD
jgi:peptidoglycan hydrolase-like protein with peptidoglycan-binding domain